MLCAVTHVVLNAAGVAPCVTGVTPVLWHLHVAVFIYTICLLCCLRLVYLVCVSSLLFQ